jgi:hypothetical protein
MQTIRDHSKFLQETMKKTFADHGEQPAATASNENGGRGGPGIVNTGASGAAATREMVDQARDKSTGKSEDVAHDARSSVKASKDSYVESNHQAKEEALQRNGPGDESPVTGQVPSTAEGGAGTRDQHGRGEGFESGSSGSALYDSATAGLGKSGPEEGPKPSAQEAHGGKEGRLGAGSSNDFNQVAGAEPKEQSGYDPLAGVSKETADQLLEAGKQADEADSKSMMPDFVRKGVVESVKAAVVGKSRPFSQP